MKIVTITVAVLACNLRLRSWAILNKEDRLDLLSPLFLKGFHRLFDIGLQNLKCKLPCINLT